jgi:hypothetical protein
MTIVVSVLTQSIQPRLMFAAWASAVIGSCWWIALVLPEVHPFLYIVSVIGGGLLPVAGAFLGAGAAATSSHRSSLVWSIAAIVFNIALLATYMVLMFPNTPWW